MSSQWKISEVNRIISLCAEGNKMYENILRKQLRSVQESEEPTKPQNDNKKSTIENLLNSIRIILIFV
jgi:hypothetical protein